MTRPAYYNEFDPYCAAWLRNLIAEGLIPHGEVDDRSIADVQAADLDGFGQCHFFAGLGGWGRAVRLAGLADDFPLWTGSCPCQPFSVAGRGGGTADERHLWPEFYRLIRERRPAVVFGEQVAGKAGLGWLDGVFADLEGSGYACGAAVVPACGVGAPHRRERLWFVADARGHGQSRDAQRNVRSLQPRQQAPQRHDVDRCGMEGSGPLADADLSGAREGREQRGGQLSRAGGDQEARAVVDASRECGKWAGERSAGIGEYTDASSLGDANSAGPQEPAGERGDARAERAATVGTGGSGFWSDAIWLAGADGKSRRVGPGLRLLAHGIPARVAKLRALGNAIVPEVAAEFVAAALDAIEDLKL